METLLAKLTDATYDFLAFVLPGLLCMFAWLVLPALLATWMWSSVRPSDFLLFYDEWLIRRHFHESMILLVMVAYLLGALVKNLAKEGLAGIFSTPSAGKQPAIPGKFPGPILRLLLHGRSKGAENHSRGVSPLLERGAVELQKRLGIEPADPKLPWPVFFRLARPLIYRHGITSLVDIHQLRYTTSLSIAYAFAVAFVLHASLGVVAVALIQPGFALVWVANSAFCALLCRAFETQFDRFWRLCGDQTVYETLHCLAFSPKEPSK